MSETITRDTITHETTDADLEEIARGEIVSRIAPHRFKNCDRCGEAKSPGDVIYMKQVTLDSDVEYEEKHVGKKVFTRFEFGCVDESCATKAVMSSIRQLYEYKLFNHQLKECWSGIEAGADEGESLSKFAQERVRSMMLSNDDIMEEGVCPRCDTYRGYGSTVYGITFIMQFDCISETCVVGGGVEEIRRRHQQERAAEEREARDQKIRQQLQREQEEKEAARLDADRKAAVPVDLTPPPGGWTQSSSWDRLVECRRRKDWDGVKEMSVIMAACPDLHEITPAVHDAIMQHSRTVAGEKQDGGRSISTRFSKSGASSVEYLKKRLGEKESVVVRISVEYLMTSLKAIDDGSVPKPRLETLRFLSTREELAEFVAGLNEKDRVRFKDQSAEIVRCLREADDLRQA